MTYTTPVDVPALIKDFQKIVVELKESEKINQSLTYAHRVAEVIQRRGGDAALRHVPGQDSETEHKENRNRQLRDLDSENRQLRQLYEDSQWTLHLVMEVHRRQLEAHFGRNNNPSTSPTISDSENGNRDKLYKNAAIMARDVNQVFEHEQQMNEAFAERIKELEIENEVLRCVLESPSEWDADAIVEQLEQLDADTLVERTEHADTFVERPEQSS
ncbi:hypothetical protein OESDEN_02912 [Oesophagostomum dentatum]|uniref:Uncharacterized protein n=1 Tax=Oesophagostomum dentatum TaxID=61180 RepID=A0A0B1TP08_OESDE|nr:hypothetical protein OESDEN_02912 [Oesophagostomum dentatum]